MLIARGLGKRFDRLRVVDDVSFEIAPGEVLGYLGPNGSGKSTTVKMITGLLRPDDGAVSFDGVDLGRDPVRFKSRLGYVPEEPHVYPHLTGWEHVHLVGRLRGLADGVIARRAERLFELWQLGEDRHVAMSAYSKGMRQKVLIASALLHDPDLVVLDEPMSGLDATAMLVFRELLAELRRRGKSILYSSHELDAVERTATRVAILSKGRIVACDRVERLRALMQSASLEDVFTRLVVHDDPAATAGAIADAVAGD